MRTSAVVRHVTVDRTAGEGTRGAHRDWCVLPRGRTRVVPRELQPFYMSHLRFWASHSNRTKEGKEILGFLLLDNALRRMSQEEQQQPQRLFEEFFVRWASSKRDLVEQLHLSLVRREDSDEELVPRIQKMIQHYRDYYEVKKGALKEDAFQVLNPPWKTPLETAFMWIGGWRPSMAFQLALVGASREKKQKLLFSEEFQEAEGGELILTGISQEQKEKLEAEQASIREQEEQISCKAAQIQKTLGDSAVVKLAQGVHVTGRSGSCNLDPAAASAKLKEVMQDKVQALSLLLLEADILRIRALEVMVGILKPLQAAQYLVTAGVLQMAFKQVGELKEKRDS